MPGVCFQNTVTSSACDIILVAFITTKGIHVHSIMVSSSITAVELCIKLDLRMLLHGAECAILNANGTERYAFLVCRVNSL